MALTEEQGEEVVRLAREAVERFTRENVVDRRDKWEKEYLNQKRGAFVTLKTEDGSLRGCVGFPFPIKPLGTAVTEAAVSAAAHDPRFPRVVDADLPDLLIEVSLLTIPELVPFTKRTELPKQIQIGVDGLIVSENGMSGLLLPQVATEYKLVAEDFLSDACMKAGLLPDAWLTDHVMVQRFQAEIFSEVSPRGEVRRGTL